MSSKMGIPDAYLPGKMWKLQKQRLLGSILRKSARKTRTCNVQEVLIYVEKTLFQKIEGVATE